jgi:hypothetical protein
MTRFGAGSDTTDSNIPEKCMPMTAPNSTTSIRSSWL